MKKMTEEFLKAAFSGESQAHMKYLIFAEKAEEEGLKNIARLFRAIAYAEYVHARNHLKELGMVGVTKDNLQAAIEGRHMKLKRCIQFTTTPQRCKVKREQREALSTH